jgi:hypothetical protein
VLTVVGPGLFGWFGVMGITKKRTLLLARPRGGGGPMWITGTPALITGLLYLPFGLLLFAVLAPVTGAMFGLW